LGNLKTGSRLLGPVLRPLALKDYFGKTQTQGPSTRAGSAMPNSSLVGMTVLDKHYSNSENDLITQLPNFPITQFLFRLSSSQSQHQSEFSRYPRPPLRPSSACYSIPLRSPCG